MPAHVAGIQYKLECDKPWEVIPELGSDLVGEPSTLGGQIIVHP